MGVCVKCGGRIPAVFETDLCPSCTFAMSREKVNKEAKQDFFGSSPNIFVGRFGYPNIRVGFLSAEDKKKEYDNPGLWASQDYDVGRVVDLRTSLINSNFYTNIKSFGQRLMDLSQEVSMAKEAVDIEVNLEKKPTLNPSFHGEASPHGPSVKLKRIEITENPKIPHKVDYVVSDNDLKAAEGVSILSDKGLDEHYLTKLLSVGNLGVKPERKLVPTRWAITAVDDILAKEIINEIQDYKRHNYTTFFGGHLGNYYLIMFLPDIWSYELFEMSVSKPVNEWSTKGLRYATDYENYKGRKEYATETAGGYYAARLPVLQYLQKRKRKGSVLVLRFITEDYWAPLGVWVCREATRKSLKSKPLEFDSKELMLKYASALAKKKFGMDISDILNNSKMLTLMKTQKKLFEFQI